MKTSDRPYVQQVKATYSNLSIRKFELFTFRTFFSSSHRFKIFWLLQLWLFFFPLLNYDGQQLNLAAVLRVEERRETTVTIRLMRGNRVNRQCFHCDTHCECGMLTTHMKKVCYHPDESCIVQFISTGPAMTWHVLHLLSRHTNVAHKSHGIYRNFASIVLNSRFFCFFFFLFCPIVNYNHSCSGKNKMLRSSCWKKRKKPILYEMLMTDVITL